MVTLQEMKKQSAKEKEILMIIANVIVMPVITIVIQIRIIEQMECVKWIIVFEVFALISVGEAGGVIYYYLYFYNQCILPSFIIPDTAFYYIVGVCNEEGGVNLTKKIDAEFGPEQSNEEKTVATRDSCAIEKPLAKYQCALTMRSILFEAMNLLHVSNEQGHLFPLGRSKSNGSAHRVVCQISSCLLLAHPKNYFLCCGSSQSLKQSNLGIQGNSSSTFSDGIMDENPP
ncbi:MAG: hypothetical protein EZS28_005172 [Streblomastix strix]|uniref:Uncharacterized protein n=1 Tax=Streblomastix strix TaxID=222440 RepID=A0A5J4WWA3_9EUKA|nr:MAG: hypothetical protein EZS28_005172 [Streblomastix strix]